MFRNSPTSRFKSPGRNVFRRAPRRKRFYAKAGVMEADGGFAVALDGKPIKGWDHADWGRPADVDMKISDARENAFTALVIPGGVLNPDKLRVDDDAMTLVKAFLSSGKIVAAVCHGPWLLVQADALRGRRATSYKSIRKDVENAGAHWVDESVVVDDGIITSRNPDDLPAFVSKIIEEVQEGRHSRRAA